MNIDRDMENAVQCYKSFDNPINLIEDTTKTRLMIKWAMAFDLLRLVSSELGGYEFNRAIKEINIKCELFNKFISSKEKEAIRGKGDNVYYIANWLDTIRKDSWNNMSGYEIKDKDKRYAFVSEVAEALMASEFVDDRLQLMTFAIKEFYKL